MTIKDVLDVLMFATICVTLMAGFPVAFTLAGTALAFAAVGWLVGAFDPALFGALPSRIFGGIMTNEILIAVPLFVFMGVMLERSRVAEDLLETMGGLFGSLPGGLGISVFVVGALMAASTGIVGATVVTMGLLSLPTMLKRGYSPALAAGSICAAGTLGQIIPPSIVLVLLADQISNAHVDAQRTLGNFAPDPVSVGDLFAGAMIPGLMLVGFYIIFQVVVAWVRPSTSPAIPRHEIEARGLRHRVFQALMPPIVLIIGVLGSIIAGVATPTESASVGAVGALLLAGRRPGRNRPINAAWSGLAVMLVAANGLDLRVGREHIPPLDFAGIAAAGLGCVGLLWGLGASLARTYRTVAPGGRAPVLVEVMRSTMKISAMVFVIVIGASVFSLVFRGLGGDAMVQAFLSSMPGGAIGAMTVVMAVMFVLGFFIDFIEIIYVVVPVVAPALLTMELNPVWLGVMIGMNLQTSFLTPPFGFALFYLRGVAPPEVTTRHIYIGIVPFVVIQLVALGVLASYPGLAMWLPKVVMG